MGWVKNETFLGWLTKNQYIGEELPKGGGLGQFAGLRGGLVKKRRKCF